MSARQANLRFKAPRHVIQFRLRVFWCNAIRVRVLHALLEPGGELFFEGFGQKPMWFTASSQEKTMALRGARKVAVKENMPMTRARFTAMTRCRWPSPPEDGKEIAVLFKAAGGRLTDSRGVASAAGGVVAVPGEGLLPVARRLDVHLLDLGPLQGAAGGWPSSSGATGFEPRLRIAGAELRRGVGFEPKRGQRP